MLWGSIVLRIGNTPLGDKSQIIVTFVEDWLGGAFWSARDVHCLDPGGGYACV